MSTIRRKSSLNT